MHNDAKRLLVAVSRAVDHKLDVSNFNDRLTMQKGCYILNSWNYGPKYKYGLYIRGPYSSELADDYYEIKEDMGDYTDVPDEIVAKLSSIFEKGLGYAEAYATVLLIKNNSPGASYDSIHRRALEVKPHLESEIEEACSSILT